MSVVLAADPVWRAYMDAKGALMKLAREFKTVDPEGCEYDETTVFAAAYMWFECNDEDDDGPACYLEQLQGDLNRLQAKVATRLDEAEEQQANSPREIARQAIEDRLLQQPEWRDVAAFDAVCRRPDPKSVPNPELENRKKVLGERLNAYEAEVQRQLGEWEKSSHPVG